MYTNIEKRGRLLAKTLAIPVINDLLYERLGLVEEGGLIDNYVTEMFKRKDIELIYLAILDEKGRVLSHNDFGEYGKLYNDPLTSKSLQSSDTVVQRFYHEATGCDGLDFATPLSIGKKRWGTLKFAISLQNVEKEIHATVLRAAIFTFVALFIGFFIIIILGRRFIGPITHLAKTMEKAGADKLDVKVDVKGRDELALLGQNFNSMIDRIRAANIELKRTHDKLLHSEKLASVGILASGVAHEINNPLGGLFNAVQMLEKNGDNEGFRRRYLGLIRNGIKKIENTVGKLLWMSRNDIRKSDVILIRQALREIYGFIEPMLTKNNVLYRENIEDNISVVSDPNDFQQAILNLLINAIQSMENTGGELTVTAYSKNSKTILKISDTGEGIEEKNIGKLFDPFYTTKTTGGGTGLGLWLAYEIVKSYNGEISVESVKGQGSRFTVEFDRTE